MKNVAIANGVSLTPHARQPLGGGASSLQRVAEFARRLPGLEKVLFLLPEGVEAPPGSAAVRQSRWSLQEVLARLREEAQGCDQVFYFYADCPFLDPGLAARMLENHRRYYADYTFADGYPYGLAPEILKPQLLPALLDLAGEAKQKPERGSIFDLVKKDINAFDIETEISPIDLRMLRVSLCADSRRNFLLLQRILEHGGEGAEGVCRVLQDRAEILRTLPAYFSVQIVEGCPQLCSYCPYPRFRIKAPGKQAEMPLERFQALLAQVKSFCGDAVIGVSLWGEPSYHSRIGELVQAVLAEEGLQLVIETSGLGWSRETLARLSGSQAKRPDWIVSLDAETQGLYRALRGEGFEEARQTARTLLEYAPGRVHLQAVRMKDNEEELESFYRNWKKLTEQVIIQKYDYFCGLLEERKVTDLSPLKRLPCWHLKRDVPILIDGTVPLCREDVRGAPLGNIFNDGLEAVWQRGQDPYLAHLRAEYPEICARCDEYYTYNF